MNFSAMTLLAEKFFRKVTTSSRSIKGAEAGSLDKRERYLRVTVDGVGYQLHRVIMLLVHGHLDKSVHVDHISHDRADNRLCNLRLVSLAENNKNKSMDRRNSAPGCRNKIRLSREPRFINSLRATNC